MAEGVCGVEQRIGGRGAGRRGTLAQPLHEVFHQVRELRAAVQSNRGRGPFQAMCEHERRRRIGALLGDFAVQQAVAQLVEGGFRLVAEDRQVMLCRRFVGDAEEGIVQHRRGAAQGQHAFDGGDGFGGGKVVGPGAFEGSIMAERRSTA